MAAAPGRLGIDRPLTPLHRNEIDYRDNQTLAF